MICCVSIVFSMQAQFPENFEGGVPPTGWASFEGVNGLGTTESWQSVFDVVSGSNVAFIAHEDAGGLDTEDWLVTPQFTPVDGANVLGFKQRQLDWEFDYFSTFEIRVSTNSQTTHADFATIDSWAELDFNSEYTNRYIDLSAYNGQAIYVAFVFTQDDGEDWFIDDIELIPQVSPPSCSIDQLSLLDGTSDVDIDLGTINVTWSAPLSGDAPLGYNVYFGTAPGQLDFYELSLGGSVTLRDLEYATTYYWQIRPYNTGGESTGCTELSFTTESAPLGATCANAINVPSIPYNDTGNTGNFLNDYSSSPGNNCGTIDSYLSGDDVVYQFTPVSDQVLNLILSNISDNYAGMFVYDDCSKIGSECVVTGAFNTNDSSDLMIDDFEVFNGTTYYVVISTWAEPQTTAYEFDIIEDPNPITINSCGGVEGSITVVSDCINSGGFFIDIEATSMGTLSSLDVYDDQGSSIQTLNSVGVVRLGPYVNLTEVVISLDGDNGFCTYDHTPLTQETCPLNPDYLNDFSMFPGVNWATGTGVTGEPNLSTSGWQIGDFANDEMHPNGRAAKVSIYGSSRDEYIISPEFNLSSGDFYLNFDIALTDFVNTTNPGMLGVDDFVALFVTQDNWDTFSELTRWDAGSTISNTGESITEIVLSGYNATTKFGFYAFSDTSNSDNEFFIDNFQITANSLSVGEEQFLGFLVYPNPTFGVVNLKADVQFESIQVFNALGQEILKTKLNSNTEKLDVSSLKSGVYILRAKARNASASIRFMKK